MLEPRVTDAEKKEEKGGGFRPWRWAALVVVVVLVIGAAMAAIWKFYFRPSLLPKEVISDKITGIKPSEKPSIAVLPFVNIGGDPNQEYFSDGITEEIITTLSKVPHLFIIARNSVFTYKGKSVKVQQVGQELGVRYVLEGSVRKAGDRVRITAQLIDAATGGHLWSERYDRNLKDIFALQDEITMKILTAVRVELTDGEQVRLHAKGTKNLDSYMKVLQGMPHFYRLNWEGNIQARQMFEEAITLDPKNSGAYSCLGWTYLMEVWFGLSDSPGNSMKRAADLAQRALVLNDTLDFPHSLLANIYLMKRQYEKAITEAERAVALNPNGADAHAHLGMTLNFAGRREEAILLLKKAIRFNPIPPTWYLSALGEAYLVAGQHEEALPLYKRVLQSNPDDFRTLYGLAATYSLLGRKEQARNAATKVIKIDPKFSIENLVRTLPFKNRIDRELLIDALREAGLPK